MITVELAQSVGFVDGVLNSSPEMRERVLADSGLWTLSLQDVLARPGVQVVRVVLDGALAGCFVCMPTGTSGELDIHTMLLPQCRGRRAVEAAIRAACLLFEQAAVSRLLATCPEHLPEVRWFAQAVGFRFLDRGFAEYTFRGEPVACVFMKLDREDLCQLPQ